MDIEIDFYYPLRRIRDKQENEMNLSNGLIWQKEKKLL
jgi:hypothetical protein